MKRLRKIIFSLFITFLSISVTYAEEDCSNIEFFASDNLASSIKMQYGNNLQTGMIYKIGSNPAYCRNAGLSSGIAYGGTNFRCTKVVFDSTTKSLTSDLTKIYEAGIVKILVSGYNANNTSSGALGYTATDLAIKTYELLAPSSINSNNTNNASNSDYLRGFKSFANKMLDDTEISQKLNEIYGSVHDKYSDAKAYSWASNGEQIETEAKRLIMLGLEESKKFKDSGAASITWNDNPVITSESSVAVEGQPVNYKSSLTYTFKISNFNSNGAFANVTFTCPNCASNGVSYIVNVNNEEVGVDYTGAIDLLSGTTNGNGEVVLRVDFLSNSNKYACEDLDYKIYLNYKDDTISNEVYNLRAVSSTGGVKRDTQQFYMLNKSNAAKNLTIDGSFALCTVTCNELKAKCDAAGTSSKACQEYNKRYPKGCVNCGVGTINNICANPGETTNLSLIEGYEVDPTTCTQGNENIKGCVIDNTDAAGNSYNYINNSACTVSCKEDFHFQLPGNLDVSSGRYFSLNVGLKATKTCYLKMKANPQDVMNQFKQGAKKTLNSYTVYSTLEAINSLEPKVEERSFGCGDKEVTVGYYGNVIYGTKDACETANEDVENADCSYHTYSKKVPATEVKANVYIYNSFPIVTGGCPPKIVNIPVLITKNPTITRNDDHCEVTKSAEKITLNEFWSSYANLLKTNIDESTAKATLVETGNAQIADGGKVAVEGTSSTAYVGGSSNSIYNVLGALNSCALWSMDYDINPDMYFSYEESYMKDVLTNKLDLNGNITKTATTKYYCSGETDDSYKLCNGSENGWSTTPIFGSESVCVCTTSGCKNESIAYNATRSMKESITYEAKYITPTQFYTIYPTGAIVAATSGSNIENGSELTNALPVGLGTPQGGHYYALYAKNLGEYFDTGKSGRVWDTGNNKSVLATTLRSLDKCATDGALKYDANVYEYIKNGVWSCNYCVNGDCSCPNCPPVVGYKCMNIDGKYFGSTGAEVDYKTYKQQCCTDKGCPVTIVLSDGKNFIYRPISTNEIKPNNRNLGLNWNYDDKQVSTALEMKAAITTNEIISDGETIYEKDDKYVMKVNLDSSMINAIKNREDKDYASNTLKCYDYTQDGKTYNNIFCYSTFIDELVNDNKTKDKITFSVERPLSEAKRKDSQNSEYWTTWTKKLESSKWSITTIKEFSYSKPNYDEIGIGPSWK